jgi:hypothetical protein
MLDFFVSTSAEQINKERLPVRLSLGGPAYWFLHRYFVHADLEPGSFSFLNLYEDTEIQGYQLHRLEAELRQASEDIRSKPPVFRVLMGWKGTEKTVESEDWQDVRTVDIEKALNEFLSLIVEAKRTSLSLWAIGD